MATISSIALNWLQLLEKEFDLSFVDCDQSLAQVFSCLSDSEENGMSGNSFNQLMVSICDARQHLTSMSAAFTQLVHKTITIANHNQYLTKELSDLRRELCEARAENNIEKQQSLEQNNEDDSQKNGLNSSFNHNNERNSFDILRTKDISETDELMRHKFKQLELRNEECKQLRKENISLRRQTVQLQSELFGSRLAAKYLDKELAGRIQQIQLLGRDVKDTDHDRLWNQLEAEIHLHRHKTVVRACRGNYLAGHELPAPPDHDSIQLKKRQGVGNIRFVTVDKDPNEGLGISITGGKEHGVPIIISQIHANTAAARTGALYVGDAILSVNSIDLKDAKHSDAAFILASQSGKCVLEVIFVAADSQSDTESVEEEEVIRGLGLTRGNYPFYDSQVIDSDALRSSDDYNNETINETESLDSSPSQSNQTVISVSSSPAKRYPGVAKLSLPKTNAHLLNQTSSQTIVNNLNQKETLID